MRRSAWIAAVMALGAGALWFERSEAAEVVVQTVIEGRARGADLKSHEAILIIGKGVSSIASLSIAPKDAPEDDLPLPLSFLSGKTMAVFLDTSDSLLPGDYTLQLVLKKSSTRQDAGEIRLTVGGLHPDIVIPPANFSAYADLVDEGKVGTGAAQVAPGAHDHDNRYYTETELNSPGALNSLANPVDWTRLKNVPLAFADGSDDGATYSAGAGLTLGSGTFAVSFAGTGTATTVARSDHDHDARYYTEAELNATGGTVNNAANPVDWSRLKGIPAAFADGTDDGVTFAGTGSANTAARSDHNHDATYSALAHNHDATYLKKAGDTATGALSIGTTGACLSASASSSSGTYDVISASAQGDNGRGVVGTSTTAGTGVYGSNTGAGVGVLGVNSSTGANAYGVKGTSVGSHGVWGTTASTVDANAKATFGVTGEGPAGGVYGFANGSDGTNPNRSGGVFSANPFGFSAFWCYTAYRNSSGVDYKIIGSGTVSAVVPTRDGKRVLHCTETPDVWFEDAGRGRLVAGRGRVDLDPLFLDTVTVTDEMPLMAVVQVEGECNGVYVTTDLAGFDVRELLGGRSDVEFTWRVLAKRRGYEHLRFEDGPTLPGEATSRLAPPPAPR